MPIVDVEKLKQGGQKFASGFTAGQKVVSVLGVVGLAVALMMFTQWSSTTDYAPLFSDMSPKDAGDVTKALDAMNVPYQLVNGGNTVQVPRSQLYKARADLSAKGLPTTNDGYSILDKGSSVTDSSRQLDIKYQRAVQIELANTIMAINGVRHASVNLALPDNDPFVGSAEKKASAAIQVDSGPVQLQASQVQSIVHLVASAVRNLSPTGITVSDTNGTLLWSASKSGAISSAENLAKKIQYEDRARSQIEQLITRSLGPGNATVVVSVDMDTDTGTKKSETHTPVLDKNGKLLTSASKTKQTQLDEDTPDPNGTGAGAATSRFKEGEQSNTPLVDTTIEDFQKSGDKIIGMHTSVVLNDAKVKQADIAKWTAAISAAAGAQKGRKDEVVVQLLPMDAKVQEVAKQQLESAANPKTPATPLDIMGIARYALTFLIVALVLFLAWRSVKKAQKAMAPERISLDLAAIEASQNAQHYAHDLLGVAAGNSSNGELSAGNGGLRAIESSRSQVELDVVDLIERQPEEVAQTLRSWLADRRT